MKMTRYFDLSDVLSITTGRLVSTRRMDGIYDIMGFMTKNDGITTLGIMDMAEVCKVALLELHPQLLKINGALPDWDNLSQEEVKAAIDSWLEKLYKIYGKMLPVEAIEGDLEYKSDIQIFFEAQNSPVDTDTSTR